MKNDIVPKTLWSRLAGAVFLLVLILLNCLIFDRDTYRFTFESKLLFNCIPFLYFYFLLSYRIFPSHVRERRAAHYFGVSILTSVVLALLWTIISLLLIKAIPMYDITGRMFFVHFLYCFLSCIITFGFFTVINLPIVTIHFGVKTKQMAAEKALAELQLIKYQLNPHFLMNTLNNIHALIEIDSMAAQDAVRMLSKLMRFMYNENSNERIDIQKDMNAMKTYFDLMRLRYIDSVDIRFNIPETMPNVKIPPCIFVYIAENAFTHGVSYKNKAFVHFDLTIEDGWVCGRVRNSRSPQQPNVNSTGFGLDALKHRLEYLYQNRYEYDVQITENEYTVQLKLPIE